jgi:hypothetical protein
MGLKDIISTLLPADYREHVLGDLQERGLSLRDIASVVPQVWWSHLRRAWNPRQPSFTGSADLQVLLARHARRAALNACLVGACLGVLNGGHYRELSARRVGLTFIAVIAGYCIALGKQRSDMRKVPASREGWLAYNRAQLASQHSYVKRGGTQFLLLLTLIQVAQEIWPALNTGELVIRAQYILATYALAVLMNQPRARRLRFEMKGLQ